MNKSINQVRAADHLVDQLVAQRVSHVYGVPGESYLPVLDALYQRESEISFITCRQEGGATMAADAHARLTGRPGVCFVTRGPGATNASAGVHIAYQDSTPLVLFIGQVARSMVEREAFQEMDYRRMFGPMAKWVAEIEDASRIQEYVTRAFRVALSGRQGPVVLALPEDMLYEEFPRPPVANFVEAPVMPPSAHAMSELNQLIHDASNPFVIVGGSGWNADGLAAFEQWVSVQNLAVAASFRCQRLLNNDHPNYIGHFSVGRVAYLDEAARASDLIISVGARLGEITTGGYSLFSPPVSSQALVHIYPSGEELGRVYDPKLGIVSDMNSFCIEAASWSACGDKKRVKTLRQHYEHNNSLASTGEDKTAAMFSHMADVLPADAIVCNGAGNYAAWLHRFYRFRHSESQLAPTSGSMGYGVPAAIAAAVARPGREVYAIAGDGCFLMNSQEMATAMHYQLSLTVIILNNARYGTIQAHQQREFPNRASGTELTNPDFLLYGKAYGAGTARVSTLEEFKDALASAREQGGIQFIEVEQSREFIAPVTV